MEVIKLKKEVKFDVENRFIKFIFGLLEGRLNGDWSEYDEGEEICYVWNLNDEDWEDIDFSWGSLFNFIGEGICLVGDEKEWYNVELKNEELKVYFNNI
jgi:hypothetical protein